MVGKISKNLFILIKYEKTSVITATVCMALQLPYSQIKEEETSKNCDIWCSYIYDPVCGTDGQNYKMFASKCFMDRQSCLENKGKKNLFKRVLF